MPLRRATRRLLVALAAGAVVAGSFTAGVVAGAGSADEAQAAAASSRLDEAASRIGADALRPVDRQALEAAAISGMLRAAGDEWGRWSQAPAGAPAAGAVAVRAVPRPGGTATVIAISSFERGTGRQVRAALAGRPADSAGVVLDLRGNGGGLLDEAVETASAFLSSGVVVRCTRRDGSVEQLDAVGTGDTSTPLAVLVDGGSASAAEVVAGALSESGRAVLVGSRTYGKGTVQEPERMSDGSSLQLTVATYTTPSGRSVEGVGLEPDLEVAPARAPGVALRRAVDVLGGLRADREG